MDWRRPRSHHSRVLLLLMLMLLRTRLIDAIPLTPCSSGANTEGRTGGGGVARPVAATNDGHRFCSRITYAMSDDSTRLLARV